jgi:hypothetical protein
VKEIIEGQVIEVEQEFLYPWEEYKDDFFDDPEYQEARRDFAAMRASKNLCHSDEIMKDPRDKPRQPASSRRMTARDVAAWVAVAAVAVAAVAVAVGW